VGGGALYRDARRDGIICCKVERSKGVIQGGQSYQERKGDGGMSRGLGRGGGLRAAPGR